MQAETEKPFTAEDFKPIKSGEEAPQWSIAEWTDGKQHTLADFRGKVLVIDFWGIWCKGCIEGFPVMKELEKKFAGKATFVTIHSAGTDMSQVKKVLELKDWNVLTGIDMGKEISQGQTIKRYGITNAADVIIIDPQGRIAFRSDQDLGAGDKDKFMPMVQALAEELKIPWPIDKDVSEEEAISRLRRIQEHLFTKEIEKALAKSAGEKK